MTVKQVRKIIEHEAKVTTSFRVRITLLTEIQGRFKGGKDNKMGSIKTKKQLFRNNLFSEMLFSLLSRFPSPKFFVSITPVSNVAFVTTSWILVSVAHPAVRMDFTVSCVISDGYTLTKSNFTSQVSLSEAKYKQALCCKL
jgi:hypothetical protein